MLSFVLFINFFTIYLPLLVFGILMPYYSKKTLLFGVNVPQNISSDEKVKRLKKIYMRNYSISLTLVMLIFYTVGFIYEIPNAFNVSVFAFILVLTANYIYIHLKVKNLKKTEGWIIDKKQVVIVSTNSNSPKRKISMKYHIIPAVIVLFTWVISAILYPNLPDQIPTHFDFKGAITTYKAKSFVTVFSVPMTQLGMLIMFYFISVMISKSKMTIDPAKPKTSEKQNLIASRRWGLFTILTSIWIITHFLYIQLCILGVINFSHTFNIIINILSIVFPLVVLTVFSLITGQSGSRVNVDSNEIENEKLIHKDDDDYWKWGLFYYNPDDPSLWIEKRFGIGWTVNFAHPVRIVLGIATIIILIVSIVLVFNT
ncbi:Uncharacterized membrane protein [Alkalithermobacter thermoalcaliphilus JW-YL-7 = DSM 7308]|uniref:Uncharacterized membrane protein n=1 Tax=Alkalithermobacter thermoalcaliphilus JW-YL-7 = DSM 7308 TaxID=1121328 RepID=A0A150FPD9_CLOPD|nr:protein of unknown function DUF1648 [[Clostridium] paradoxum JW-YL-7 = DSM 7308]SHL04732.1 Uncharacterized membrane protein [[Clostridium] paradoxum JW-YL-7 = DSM 7308]